MVLGSCVPLPVGRRHVGTVTISPGRRYPMTPVFVLREATVEEWRLECVAEGIDPTKPQPWRFYYDVSVD